MEKSVPPYSIRPLSTASSPAVQRRRVVFPQPLGPSRQNNSPSCISKQMLLRATTVPEGELNSFLTFSYLSCGHMLPRYDRVF